MTDRDLGMNRNITRRDLLHGMGALAATSFLPGQAFADAVLAAEQAGVYPPALTGLRGSHVGSFEVAHQLAREGKRDWGPVADADDGLYDLIVVGAGISGLAAAHFYRQEHPDARILILDNHDDFGGHAKRNEFTVGGKNVIGYGGSQTLQEPSGYPQVAKQLLRDLGIEVDRFNTAYDQEFYRRHDLGGGLFFNKEKWGADALVRYDLGAMHTYLPLAKNDVDAESAVQAMPMTQAAKAEMLRLLTSTEDTLAGMSADEREEYLYSTSYRDFLSEQMGVTEPEVFAALQDLTADLGVGIEATAAGGAMIYALLPGVETLGFTPDAYDEPYIHHFPDGNASVARLLVRQMIPDVAPGSTMEDVVTAQFDYSKLDRSTNPVRLRLNSTVVNAKHGSGPAAKKAVDVTYVNEDKAYRVRGKHCVLACYNAMIPYICPELPQAQRQALSNQVKSPVLYTSVALRNWKAWKKLGIGAYMSPGSYHINAMLDFPVSIGEYSYSGGPDEPVVVHMERFPHPAGSALDPKTQFRMGRAEMLATPFETIERSIRTELGGALGAGGFDPARDIEAITVNRWAHGYSYFYNILYDPWYPDRNDERFPHVRARQPHGRIAIANSDAGASPMFESAVAQAHRAVAELG